MGEDKIFMSLEGIPVLARTVSAFQRSPVIDEIVLVTGRDRVMQAAELCREYGVTKLARVVRGGETRTASACAGVRECSDRAELIAIHDGARPLVSGEVIASAVAAAAECGAAAPAVQVKDTVRQVRGGAALRTLEREELYLVQTPQVFAADMIRDCLEDAVNIGIALTDDCQAVMLHDNAVRMTQGDYANIKLTTREDVYMARAILAAGEGLG